MIEWKYVKLKQLIQDIGDGGTPSTSDNGNFGGSIHWAVVDDVKPEIYTTKETLTEKGYKRCSAKLWPVDSIILTTGATIGEVGITKIELCTKQGITGIVPNKWTNNLFLRYWLENNKQQLVRYSQGTTFKEIRPRPLGNLRIKIPEPFTEISVKIQEKIASILSTVDKNIEQTKKTIEKVEKLKKSMMQNLLTGKIKPDGTKRREDEFCIDEKFGKVPKGWDIGKAKDFFVLQRGYDLPDSQVENGKYPVVKSNGVDIYHNEYKENGPGVITGRSGSIGNVNYINSNYWPHNTSLFIKDFKGNHPKFIYYYLQYMHLERLLAGTSVPTLNRNDVHRIKITFPRNNDQKQITKILDLIVNRIKILDLKISKIQKLKKSLMQNLLTGKIEVK